MDYSVRDAFNRVKNDFAKIKEEISALGSYDKEFSDKLNKLDDQLIDLTNKLNKTYRIARQHEDFTHEVKSINLLRGDIELLKGSIEESGDSFEKQLKNAVSQFNSQLKGEITRLNKQKDHDTEISQKAFREETLRIKERIGEIGHQLDNKDKVYSKAEQESTAKLTEFNKKIANIEEYLRDILKGSIEESGDSFEKQLKNAVSQFNSQLKGEITRLNKQKDHDTEISQKAFREETLKVTDSMDKKSDELAQIKKEQEILLGNFKKELEKLKIKLAEKDTSVNENLNPQITKIKQEIEAISKQLDNKEKLLDDQLIDLTNKLNKTYRIARQHEDFTHEVKSINLLRGDIELLKGSIEESGDSFEKQLKNAVSQFNSQLKGEITRLNKQKDHDTEISQKAFREETLRIKERIGEIGHQLDNKDKVYSKAEQESTAKLTEFNKKIANIEEYLGDIKRIQDSSIREINKKISLLGGQLSNKDKLIAKIENKFDNNVLADRELCREIKKLNEHLDADTKYQVNRIKFEEHLKKYREKRIDSLRSTLLPVFLAIAAFAVLALYYFRSSGLLLPGIINKMIIVLIILIILLIVFITPKNIFIRIGDIFSLDKLKEKTTKIIDFLAGEKE